MPSARTEGENIKLGHTVVKKKKLAGSNKILFKWLSSVGKEVEVLSFLRFGS